MTHFHSDARNHKTNILRYNKLLQLVTDILVINPIKNTHSHTHGLLSDEIKRARVFDCFTVINYNDGDDGNNNNNDNGNNNTDLIININSSLLSIKSLKTQLHGILFEISNKMTTCILLKYV